MFKRKKIYQILFWLFPAVVIVLLSFFRVSFIQQIDNIFLDNYISQTKIPEIDEKIVLIMGSDESVKEIGMWPWSRDYHARLINEYLKDAKTVAMDILFADESAKEYDDSLKEAIRNHGNVILAYVEEETGKTNLHSLNKFIEAAYGEGFVNGFRDADGISRRYRILLEEDIIVPSFVTAALMASGYEFDWNINKNKTIDLTLRSENKETNIKLNSNFDFLRFPASKYYYQIYEYSDVLNGKVPKEAFDNAIVFVGFDAAGTSDVISASEGIVSGTRYNADSMITLLSGTNPMRAGRILEAVIAVIIFGIVWICCYKLNKNYSWTVPIIVFGVIYVINRQLFLTNTLWFGTAIFIVSIISAYIFAILSRFTSIQWDLHTSSVSIDSLLELGSKLSMKENYAGFDDYIGELSKEIEKATGIAIIQSITAFKDLDVNLSSTEPDQGMYIVYNLDKNTFRHHVLLRLPDISEEYTQPMYTHLGMVKKANLTTIKSVATIVITSYVYFNVSQEAQKRTDLFYNLIQCMISAIDAKDPITSGHSLRVAELSEKIATWLNLSKTQIEQIKFSGIIHDLGKIGIPDSILGKPSPFSDHEFAVMKEHPLMGASIIESMQLEDEILDGILYHHERLDGKGYPYGKKDSEISLTARIIRIADVYDALAHERQYKKAWSVERVLNLLYEGRGSEFDEGIVDIVIDKMKPEGFTPTVYKRTENKISDFVVNKYRTIYDKFIRIYKEAGLEQKKELLRLKDYDGNDILCGRSFLGMAWYLAYYTPEFMMQYPYVLHAEGDELFFAQKGTGGINYIIYYFLRGFLTAGYLICENAYVEKVKEELNESVEETEHFHIYDKGRMNILCSENTVFYIMKSILDG